MRGKGHHHHQQSVAIGCLIMPRLASLIYGWKIFQALNFCAEQLYHQPTMAIRNFESPINEKQQQNRSIDIVISTVNIVIIFILIVLIVHKHYCHECPLYHHQQNSDTVIEVYVSTAVASDTRRSIARRRQLECWQQGKLDPRNVSTKGGNNIEHNAQFVVSLEHWGETVFLYPVLVWP